MAQTQDSTAAKAEKPPAPLSQAKEIGQQVRKALEAGVASGKQLNLGGGDTPPPASAASAARAGAVKASGPKTAAAPAVSTTRTAPAVSAAAPAQPNPKASRQAIRARAAALAASLTAGSEKGQPAAGERDVHWDYGGSNGPQSWGQLEPEFATCASGKRQSPIDIDDSQTLRGPAEVIGFEYRASSGTVVNNGHTIQIDMQGNNQIRVRGSRYQLQQVHFHHPSEERINQRSFAMVAHLVHKDFSGRLAVVAVLLEPGAANPVINQFWTYMPLGPGDQVTMPAASVDLTALLPKDPRYYQFMGSLTTPPCTEGVLWMVMKQPVTLSPDQLRLFAQQFPDNARPVQPTNERVVREAQ